jgi:hypothetical protein
MALSCFATKGHKKKAGPVEQAMTVAAIRPPQTGETSSKITFLQSQRFYKLPGDADPKYMSLLRASEQKHTAVIIVRENESSDVILSVREK